MPPVVAVAAAAAVVDTQPRRQDWRPPSVDTNSRRDNYCVCGDEAAPGRLDNEEWS